jgi:2-dehydropantoate 2-reductase
VESAREADLIFIVPPDLPSSAVLGRIAVVGSGAVGSYYGAQLSRVGESVHFLLRRDLSAVRERGLTIRQHRGEPAQFHLHHVSTAATSSEIGPVDLVLVALKATANAAFLDLISPLLHTHTAILTLQNGLGNEEELGALFGAERIMGGLCFVCLNRAEPGAVDCFHPGSITIGEYCRPAAARTRALADAWIRAGVRCSVSDTLAEVRWRKLVWNVPFNGLTIAAGGVTTDRIVGNPELLEEARALMREIQAAAAAHGFRIPDAFLQSQIDVTVPMDAYKPSSLIDFLDGRAVEVEAIWGEPLRRARAAGVDTPHLAALYARLRQMCRAA